MPTRRSERSALPPDEPGGPFEPVEQPSLLPAESNPSLADPTRQEVFIPIHGQVRLTASEITVLNHPAVQRLALIYQLGQTHLVYRGATHRRFEHTLGTLHVVQLMIEAVNQAAVQPAAVPDQGDWVLDDPLSQEEQAFVRLGALLHDLGHLPAGHTLEDELGLLPRHDSVDRFRRILDRKDWFGTATRALRAQIDELYSADAVASGLNKSASDVLLDLVASDRDPPSRVSLSGFRVEVCKDLIGNTLCADILDYLHRDWHHLGKPKFFDTRILEYMQIRRRLVEQREPAVKDSLVVVNLRSRDAVRTDAVTLILDLLESRYQLHEMALYHRTKLSAAAMLERVIGELADGVPESKRDRWLSDLTDDLLTASDEQMLELLDSRAVELSKEVTSKAPPSSIQAIRDLVLGLRTRRLHKRLHVMFAHQLGTDVQAIQERYAPSRGAGHRPAINRLRALRLLEEDFGLPVGSLVMYCPPAKMPTKIAEVTVLVDGVAKSLAEFEEDPFGSATLTGGHLFAQGTRFQRLWRIHFAMRQAQMDELRSFGYLGTLIRGIECLVLGRRQGDTSLLDAARSVAVELTNFSQSPLKGADIGPTSVAARAKDVTLYPTGVPSLRAFTR